MAVFREGLDAPGPRPIREEHDAALEVGSPHLEGNLVAGAVDLVALEGEVTAVREEEPDGDRRAFLDLVLEVMGQGLTGQPRAERQRDEAAAPHHSSGSSKLRLAEWITSSAFSEAMGRVRLAWITWKPPCRRRMLISPSGPGLPPRLAVVGDDGVLHGLAVEGDAETQLLALAQPQRILERRQLQTPRERPRQGLRSSGRSA